MLISLSESDLQDVLWVKISVFGLEGLPIYCRISKRFITVLLLQETTS